MAYLAHGWWAYFSGFAGGIGLAMVLTDCRDLVRERLAESGNG
jgi:hypothetical protein